MERVSSQLTILLRIALPTIWFTALASLLVLLIFAVQGKAQVLANPIIWIVFLVIGGTGYAFIHFILWRLYRIDVDENHIYVSNYFKTFKYPYNDIASIEDSKVLPGKVFIIKLKSKGSFGKDIVFLASPKLLADFMAENPELFRELYHRNQG